MCLHDLCWKKVTLHMMCLLLFMVCFFLYFSSLMDGKMYCVRIPLYARSSWIILDFVFRELGLDVWIQGLSDNRFDEIMAQ